MPDGLYLGFRDDKTGHPVPASPKQRRVIRDFLDDDNPYRFFLLDGGTRSGKTITAVRCAIEYALRHPGLNCLFSHIDNASLQSSLIYHLKNMVPETMMVDGKEVKIRFENKKDQRIEIRLPGLINEIRGYTLGIDYRPLDPSKNLHIKLRNSGASYGIMLFDQVELMTGEVWQAALTRLSLAPYKIICTANPDPNQWFYHLWITGDGVKKDEVRSFYRMQMNPGDNPGLDKRYIETLRRRYTKALADRYIYGSYSPIEGRILKCFDEGKHLMDPLGLIPSDWHVYEAIDYGYTDPCVIQWWGVDPQDNLYLIDSLTLRFATPEEISRAVLSHRQTLLSMGREEGEAKAQFQLTIGDPSMSRRDAEGHPLTEQLEEKYVNEEGDRLLVTLATSKGMPSKQVKNTRIQLVLDHLMANKIKIANHCRNWLSQQSIWVWDKRKKDTPLDIKPRNADGTVIHHFDEMDATLYFVSWYLRNFQVENEEIDPNDFDYPSEMKAKQHGPTNRFKRNRKVYA